MTTNENTDFQGPYDISRLQAEAQRMRAEAMAETIVATWGAIRRAARPLAALVRRAAAGIEARRQYDRLYADLSRMSDRDLADIGVSRGDIAAIADGTFVRVDTTAEIVPLRPAPADRKPAEAAPFDRAA